jgi:hypothetical protein
VTYFRRRTPTWWEELAAGAAGAAAGIAAWYFVRTLLGRDELARDRDRPGEPPASRRDAPPGAGEGPDAPR